MPEVKVRYRSAVVPEDVVNQLCDALPKIVAEALTCDDPYGELTPDDIEIYPARMNHLARSKYDLEIRVELNDYRSRRLTLEQRAHQIAIGLRMQFNDIYGVGKVRPKAWVWVRVCPGEWVEI